MWFRRAALSLLVVSLALVVGCTPGARSTAGGIVSQVSPLAPLLCKAIPALQGNEVCAETTAIIDEAGQILGGILTALGGAGARRAAEDVAPMHIRITTASGVAYVTLPSWQGRAVLARGAAK